MTSTPKELTLDLRKAQITGGLLGLTIVFVLLLPYYLIFGTEEVMKIREFFRLSVFIPSAVIGIVVHEFIHGLTWAVSAKMGLANIKFGFQLKSLTPYAHSKLPMKTNAYRMGAVMPLLLMGVLPYLFALISNNPYTIGFGLFFSFVASGDIMILWLIRKLPGYQLIQDHPTKGGVIVLDNQE
jgi:hypothetical protein